MFGRAVALHRGGRIAEARSLYEQVARMEPRNATALHLLGLANGQLGDLAAARDALERAVRIDPASAPFRSSLGTTLIEQGDWEKAEIALKDATRLDQRLADGWRQLGRLYRRTGRWAEAEDALRRLTVLCPREAAAHAQLAEALEYTGNLSAAFESYRDALNLDQNQPELWNRVGILLRRMGHLGTAQTSLEQALALQPSNVEAMNNLANVLRDRGLIDDAIAAYRRILDIRPDFATARSNLLLCLNYAATIDDAVIAEESRAWNTHHAAPRRARRRPHGNDRTPDRRLRIGYVSPDFRTHSVNYFFEPLLDAHDRDAVEIFCYSLVATPDAVTARLAAKADHWRPVFGMEPDAIAATVRNDRIDILIDLAGHTSDALIAFADKPAPVQVSWLGYPNTTGLETIDYRLTDPIADPPGAADALHTETLLRLPDGFLAYRPPTGGPPVAPAPHRANGYVTFGSFNNLAKVTPRVVAAWADILSRTPRSRLLLKCRPFSDEATRAQYMNAFVEAGISADRILLRGWTNATEDHLAAYAELDVALDTFPYAGTTTTCEALWMGVPVITLSGDRHAARVGESLLTRLDLNDLVARDVEAYVAKAVALAGDGRRLDELRADLRGRMERSPLMNATAFAASMEQAYRSMWHTWCARADDETETRTGTTDDGVTLPDPLRLHIGGKESKPGWSIFNVQPGPNVDFIGNCTDLSMFPDMSCEEIYASHVLEHLSYRDEILPTLQGIHRVLKPGGLLRVAVPDLDVLCRLFIDPSLTVNDRFHVMRMMFGGQVDAYDLHKIGFNFEFMEGYLKKVGFHSIRKVTDFGLFDDASRIRFAGTPISLNVEARR